MKVSLSSPAVLRPSSSNVRVGDAFVGLGASAESLSGASAGAWVPTTNGIGRRRVPRWARRFDGR